jgi:hypothetical protein
MTIAISGVGTRAITTIEADEATALSDFLKMENEIKGKKHREKTEVLVKGRQFLLN